MSPTLRQPPEPADQDARLAELLDTCLRAERGAPGSAAQVVREAPNDLRDELGQLLALARALNAADWPAASPGFRADARAHFEAATQPTARQSGAGFAPRRVAPWLLRLAAGAAAVALVGFGSVQASVGSLPGEPLYAVKQADEFVTLGLSRDDGTRALVLLRQAGVRLDEATRLADSGQVQTAADLLQQYVGTLERAAASLSRAPSVDAKLSTDYQALLQQQLSQLESLARDAPAPLRPTIQQAQLAATQELGGSQAAGQPAPPPTPSAPAVSPAVSPSPAASPATGAPARAPASPSPLSSPVGQPSPTEP